MPKKKGRKVSVPTLQPHLLLSFQPYSGRCLSIGLWFVFERLSTSWMEIKNPCKFSVLHCPLAVPLLSHPSSRAGSSGPLQYLYTALSFLCPVVSSLYRHLQKLMFGVQEPLEVMLWLVKFSLQPWKVGSVTSGVRRENWIRSP